MNEQRKILCGQLLVFKQFETMTFKFNRSHDYLNRISDRDIESVKIWLRIVIANYDDYISNELILGSTFVSDIIYGRAFAS